MVDEEGSEIGSSNTLINTSKDYIDNHVDDKLHPGFTDQGITYSPNKDCFAQQRNSSRVDDSLVDRQQRFAKALQEYEEQVDPKYRTGFSLHNTYTWEDVLKRVELARNQYNGVREQGNVISIRNRLRNFGKAAPAIQGWLKLLPANSMSTSVFCGGLGLILGAAVRLGKLREDTFDILDQIPLQIEKAEMLVRMYGTNMEEHTAELYKAILDVLQHILSWYKRKAGLKLFSSFCKGSAYASTLNVKMEAVKKASEMMGDKGDAGMHQRLKDIHEVTLDTQTQTYELKKEHEELKKLALDARNHLYMIFRDADLRQEFVQNLVALNNSSKRYDGGSPVGTFTHRERDALLQRFGHDQEMLMHDVEDALHELYALPLNDQDRVAAIIEDDTVQDWIVNPEGQAILIHGNCRRDEILSPTSAATAMLVRELSDRFSGKTLKVTLLYWFCGSHMDGLHGSVLGMVRSFICQLVSRSFAFEIKDHDQIDDENLEELLDVFLDLLKQLPEETTVICFIDGISFYEGDQQQEAVCKAVGKISKMVRSERIFFKLFMTSPKRTSYLTTDSAISRRVEVVEIPQHIDGLRQGFRGSSPL